MDPSKQSSTRGAGDKPAPRLFSDAKKSRLRAAEKSGTASANESKRSSQKAGIKSVKNAPTRGSSSHFGKPKPRKTKPPATNKQAKAQINDLESKDSGASYSIPPSLCQSAGFLLNYNARIIRERLMEVLSPMHLTLRELGLLRILADEGTLNQHELGRKHGIDRTSVVQLIDQLEARQLVERSRNKDDRRSKLIFLTPRGRKTLLQAKRLVEKEQKAFLSDLSEEEWEILRVLLLKLLSSQLRKSTKPDSEGL